MSPLGIFDHQEGYVTVRSIWNNQVPGRVARLESLLKDAGPAFHKYKGFRHIISRLRTSKYESARSEITTCIINHKYLNITHVRDITYQGFKARGSLHQTWVRTAQMLKQKTLNLIYFSNCFQKYFAGILNLFWPEINTFWPSVDGQTAR